MELDEIFRLALPCLRDDIRIVKNVQNNEVVYTLIDEEGIAEQPVTLDEKTYTVIKLVDNILNASEIKTRAKILYNIDVDEQSIVHTLYQLDELGFVDSDRLRAIKMQIELIKTEMVRNPVCVGSVYPEDSMEADIFFEKILNENQFEGNQNTRMVLAPHLDYRVGNETLSIYGKSFDAFRKECEKNGYPELIVLLGTAHYRSTADFMYSNKDFLINGEVLTTNKELVNTLVNINPNIANIDELAHYPEHSLELHLTFIQHIMKGKQYTILPILTGNPMNYILNNINILDDKEYVNYLDDVKLKLDELGIKYFVFASGDMSHIGRKFDDEYDARDKIEEVKSEDEELIKNLKEIKAYDFFEKVKHTKNANKICGVAPFIAALSLTKPTISQEIGYGVWDEEETQSAVTYCGIVFE